VTEGVDRKVAVQREVLFIHNFPFVSDVVLTMGRSLEQSFDSKAKFLRPPAKKTLSGLNSPKSEGFDSSNSFWRLWRYSMAERNEHPQLDEIRVDGCRKVYEVQERSVNRRNNRRQPRLNLPRIYIVVVCTYIDICYLTCSSISIWFKTRGVEQTPLVVCIIYYNTVLMKLYHVCRASAR